MHASRNMVLTLLLAAACGDPTKREPLDGGALPASASQVAFDSTMPPYVLAQPTPFVRIDLHMDEQGVVTRQALSRSDLTIQPLPPMTMEYLLVAYAGQRVVTSVPVVFDRSAHASRLDANGSLLHDELPLTDAVATAYVPATQEFDRLALTARDGSMPLEVAPGDLTVLATPPRPNVANSGPAVSQLRQGLSKTDLARLYPHIAFLEPGDEWAISELVRHEVTREIVADLITPSAEMYDEIGDALAHCAPALLSAGRSIAVVRWRAGAKPTQTESLGLTRGGIIALNAAKLTGTHETQETLTHELAHVFMNLVDDSASGMAGIVWSPEQRSAAAELVQRFDLARGFSKSWTELHESGIAGGFTTGYVGDGWDVQTDAAASAGGFASPYGMRKAAEDIAEYVAKIGGNLVLRPTVCPASQGLQRLTVKAAIPYAKLVLLRALGAIDQWSFDDCAGAVAIDGPSGINFEGGGKFTSDVHAGRRSGQGPEAIGVFGTGPSEYKILIQLIQRGADVSPLGLYRLSSIDLGSVSMDGLSGIYLSHPDIDRARGSRAGYVLITEASVENVKGVVLGLSLQNGGGLITDRWPLGTISVP